MIITTQLEKNLSEVINKPVNLKDTIIGKIIEYDKETGIAKINIEEIFSSDIMEDYNIGISSREIKT